MPRDKQNTTSLDDVLAKIQDLSERLVKAEHALTNIMIFIRDAETELDIEEMPEGEYYGTKF